MSLLRNIRSGLRSPFRKEQVDRELDQELRAYQEMAAKEKMKDGMSRKPSGRYGRRKCPLRNLVAKRACSRTDLASLQSLCANLGYPNRHKVQTP
jgi:hypothetical protein